MASASSEPPVFECPVCNDFYKKPKLLMCGHVLCRDCIVSWLQSNAAALCPLCRDTMVDTQKGQAACYETIADALADDVAMAAVVESATFLGRKHVCCIHLDLMAVSLCRECNDTFCLTCSDYHKNLPATRHHCVEDLAALTVEKLATKRQAVCKTHTDKMAEVFCSTHHVPICHVCALLEHRNCPELSDLKKKSEVVQGHLEQLLAELKNADMAMKQTMNELDHLVLLIDKNTQDEIQDLGIVCSHLHTLVDACQKRLTEAIQNANAKNKSMVVVAKDSLTKRQGKVVSHRLLVERVQQAVSGSELFEMTSMLKARVRDFDLDATTLSNLKSTSLASLVVDPDRLNIVENSLSQFRMISVPFNFETGGQSSVSKGGSKTGDGEQALMLSIFGSLDIQLHKAKNAYKPGIVENDNKDQKLYRQFKAILNKLTLQKFSTLVQQALTLEINTEERMKRVTDLIFEKALREPTFSVAYANMCKSMLMLTKVPSSTNPREFVQFRTILLIKCQREFESDKTAELDLTRREQEIGAAPEGKKAELKEALAEATTKARQRSLGNIRFIGELFKQNMLTENIMHDCVFKLLKSRDDESLECLCQLLTTIGRELETPKAKLRMDQYFQHMNKIKEDMRLISRVRFRIQDVIDLRQNKWVPRRTENKPTIDQIHKEAAQEQVQRQIMLNTPMPKQEQTHGGGHRHGSLSFAVQDGLNTVSRAKTMQTPIDASKMKLSQPNLDETNIQLGPGGGQKFSQWGRGSQGDGLRFQEQDKPPMNQCLEGRSPARGDRRDREGGVCGHGKPGNRGSQESERDRAVATVRSLQHTGSGSSNPSSRNASRDNSRNRERPETIRRPGGPDALKMTSDQDLQWLESDAEAPLTTPPMSSRPTGWVADKLTDRLREKKTENEKVFDWIESNVSKEEQKSKSFIRELMTAVCRSAISGTTGNAKLLPEMITTRRAILLKYLENRPELELQALFALQALVNKLEHPPGLLRSFFDTLYDEEIISEEAFTTWEETDEQSKGKTISLLNTQQFFVWLHDWEEDS